MKNLQGGRSRDETLRRESSKQNLAKSSVLGQWGWCLAPEAGRIPMLVLM